MAAPAIYSTINQEGIDINSVFTLDSKTPEYPAPPFIPGTTAWGTDGSSWVYCLTSLSLPSGAVCVISEIPGQWSVTLSGGATIASSVVPTGNLVGVVSGSQGSLVVPACSGTQIANYFWLQRAGNCQNVLTTTVAVKDSPLFSNATSPGKVSSTGGGVGTSYAISGLIVSQAAGSTSGPNSAVLNWPSVGIPS
jgi:hypothetical protein